jgi:pimeloyl-ACP methyl ester carboxylesterase
MNTTYRTQTVDEVEIFYRESGPTDGPVVLLSHGFPTSSHILSSV